MNLLKRIYSILLKEYGFQGWWPVTPVNYCSGSETAPIYGIATKNDKQRLEIIFGAVLTQNTQWKPNVERAIIELNKLNLIDINQILKVKHEILAQAIKSSGYFNQKAKKLKNVAEFLNKCPIKKLRKMDLWESRKLLLNINGIGPETADSILLYALDKQIFVIDAYTRRIFANLGVIKPEAAYDEVQKLFMDNLEHNHRIFKEYHALIVEHAKRHYSKKPYGKNDLLLKAFA